MSIRTPLLTLDIVDIIAAAELLDDACGEPTALASIDLGPASGFRDGDARGPDTLEFELQGVRSHAVIGDVAPQSA